MTESEFKREITANENRKNWCFKVVNDFSLSLSHQSLSFGFCFTNFIAARHPIYSTSFDLQNKDSHQRMNENFHEQSRNFARKTPIERQSIPSIRFTWFHIGMIWWTAWEKIWNKHVQNSNGMCGDMNFIQMSAHCTAHHFGGFERVNLEIWSVMRKSLSNGIYRLK